MYVDLIDTEDALDDQDYWDIDGLFEEHRESEDGPEHRQQHHDDEENDKGHDRGDGLDNKDLLKLDSDDGVKSEDEPEHQQQPRTLVNIHQWRNFLLGGEQQQDDDEDDDEDYDDGIMGDEFDDLTDRDSDDDVEFEDAPEHQQQQQDDDEERHVKRPRRTPPAHPLAPLSPGTTPASQLEDTQLEDTPTHTPGGTKRKAWPGARLRRETRANKRRALGWYPQTDFKVNEPASPPDSPP